MFSSIGSNIIFNEIEYFTYLNIWLLCLFFFIFSYWLLIICTSSKLSSIYFNHSWMEFFGTILSLIFLIFIISPALIILLDYDISIIPSFIIYSLGYQWSWSFNIAFLSYIICNRIGFTAYCDHYIISSFFLNSHFINSSSSLFNTGNIIISNNAFSSYSSLFNNGNITSLFKFYYQWLDFNCNNFSFDPINYLIFSIPSFTLNNNNFDVIYPFYFFDINSYIIFPLLSGLKIFVFSFDVIHSFGFYSFGIKIDTIPGRINVATTLRALIKGEHRGFCFELCGQGHSSMLLLGLTI